MTQLWVIDCDGVHYSPSELPELCSAACGFLYTSGTPQEPANDPTCVLVRNHRPAIVLPAFSEQHSRTQADYFCPGSNRGYDGNRLSDASVVRHFQLAKASAFSSLRKAGALDAIGLSVHARRNGSHGP